MDVKAHWEHIYQTKGPDQTSWFEPEATLSLALVQRVAPRRNEAIIDVGAGASTFVDGLLNAGYRRITVLDISAAALEQAKRRLGEHANTVEWREANVLTADLSADSVDVWHDRAVFHFLIDAASRRTYVAQMTRALRPGAFALIATFAENGPTRCSGLEVARYSPQAIEAELGGDFQRLESHQQTHITPWGAPQAFTHCLFRYTPAMKPDAS